jgi:hypothetical protein
MQEIRKEPRYFTAAELETDTNSRPVYLMLQLQTLLDLGFH